MHAVWREDTHCVLLHFLPLNYTREVPFTPEVDMINMSISLVKDRLNAACHMNLAANLTTELIKFQAYTVYKVVQSLTLHKS